MSERPEDKRPTLLELMEELDQLAEEQRRVDLRNPAALEDYQRRLDALRQKIKRLNE
jgi:hypothetical protein